jgi:hypothetical protein
MHEREHENLGNINHLIDKKKALSETIRVNKTKLNELKVIWDSNFVLIPSG